MRRDLATLPAAAVLSFRLTAILLSAVCASAQDLATNGPDAPETSATSQATEASCSLEEIRILALEAPKRAVIRLPETPLRVVAPGDVIAEARAEVVAVGVDKLIVETVTDDAEPTRLRAWIFRSREIGEASRVLRLDPRAPVIQPSRRPNYLSLEADGAPEETPQSESKPEGGA